MPEIMYKLIREVEERALQQGMQQGLLDGVRSLGKTLGLEPSKALESLGVPEADWPRYLALL